MPYLSGDDRKRLDPALEKLEELFRDGGVPPGWLNYAITRLVTAWTEGISMGAPGYAELSMALGQLEAAKTEFYRRVVAPYENAKLRLNGDVYDGLDQLTALFERV